MSATIGDLAARLGGLRGKKVLVRSDLNMPMDDGVITDGGRIQASFSGKRFRSPLTPSASSRRFAEGTRAIAQALTEVDGGGGRW